MAMPRRPYFVLPRWKSLSFWYREFRHTLFLSTLSHKTIFTSPQLQLNYQYSPLLCKKSTSQLVHCIVERLKTSRRATQSYQRSAFLIIVISLEICRDFPPTYIFPDLDEMAPRERKGFLPLRLGKEERRKSRQSITTNIILQTLTSRLFWLSHRTLHRQISLRPLQQEGNGHPSLNFVTRF